MVRGAGLRPFVLPVIRGPVASRGDAVLLPSDSRAARSRASHGVAPVAASGGGGPRGWSSGAPRPVWPHDNDGRGGGSWSSGSVRGPVPAWAGGIIDPPGGRRRTSHPSPRVSHQTRSPSAELSARNRAGAESTFRSPPIPSTLVKHPVRVSAVHPPCIRRASEMAPCREWR